MIVAEGLEHSILDCPVYSDIRQISTILQILHIEDAQQLISSFLFNDETILENKDILYNIWKKETGKYTYAFFL